MSSTAEGKQMQATQSHEVNQQGTHNLTSSSSLNSTTPCSSSSSTSSSPARSFCVFEFFAGLGGFRLSLPWHLPVHSITAVEVDHKAGETYRLNFREVAQSQEDTSNHSQPSHAAPPRAAKLTHRERKARDRERAAAPDAAERAAAYLNSSDPNVRRKAERRALGALQQAQRRAEKAAAEANTSSAPAEQLDEVAFDFDQDLGKTENALQVSQSSTSHTDASLPAAVAPSPAVPPAEVSEEIHDPEAMIHDATATAISSSSSRHSLSSLCNTVLSSVSLPSDVLHHPSDAIIPPAPFVSTTGGGGARLWNCLIEHVSPQSLVSTNPELHPTIWLMSPPCQPFTRTKNSLQLGGADKRNAALRFLLGVLKDLPHASRPQHIFLENVKHFFGSDVHELLWESLTRCGYHITQYVLSPLQFGVPNHRTRFYASAEKRHHDYRQAEEERDQIQVSPPGFETSSQGKDAQISEPIGRDAEDSNAETFPAAASTASSAAAMVCAVPAVSLLPRVLPPQPLSSFLDTASITSAAECMPSETSPGDKPRPSLVEALTVPDWVLAEGWWLSVVSPADTMSYCVTGGYGRIMHSASGSLLLFRGKQAEVALETNPLDRIDGLRPYAGALRFFSPWELLRIFGFPSWYRFPPHFTLQHCYKLIGNSLNLTVVKSILHHHLKQYCQ